MDFPIIIICVSPLSFLGAAGVILKFYSIFRWNSCKKTVQLQMRRCVLWRHIWDSTVCLCPIKRTPGSNEFIITRSCILLYTIAICLFYMTLELTIYIHIIHACLWSRVGMIIHVCLWSRVGMIPERNDTAYKFKIS